MKIFYVPKTNFCIYYYTVIRREFLTKEEMFVQRSIEDLLCNPCCRGKEISLAKSEHVSAALFIQHAQNLRRIIFTSVVCPSVPYFPTLAKKQHDFRKRKFIQHKIYFDICQNST
jgi:hypothetical protein